MLTPEQFHALHQMLGQLSEEERETLLEMLHSPTNRGMWQFNSDKTKSFQVEVNGGTAYVGDIHIDRVALEQALRSVMSDFVQSLPYNNFLDASNDFLDSNDDEPQYAYQPNIYEPSYTVEDYTNSYSAGYSRSSSDIGIAPVVIGVLAVIGLGAFFSGFGAKTAVVTTPGNLNAANVRDDAGKIQEETIPDGTKVRLTGKQDGDYCETNHGWIYCKYLAESTPEKPFHQSVNPSKEALESTKRAVVQPDVGQNAVNLRSQPNAGKVIGTIPKGQQVQVIRCIADGCEVRSGSIQGWIYKPYLR
jgi:hypothetical protein